MTIIYLTLIIILSFFVGLVFYLLEKEWKENFQFRKDLKHQRELVITLSSMLSRVHTDIQKKREKKLNKYHHSLFTINK